MPSPSLRIVVTDDEPTKVTGLATLLQEAGHCVFAAYDGKAALELIAHLPGIHLLITNTRIGEVDGPELVRRSRELRPAMPILHVTYADGPDLAGVANLREPLTAERLVAAIERLVD